MSDPAIEAAQRAGEAFSPASFPEELNAMPIAAAREMAKPVRELHRKVRLYWLTQQNCVDTPHDIFEDEFGEWACKTCTEDEEYVCAHCADQDTNSVWPCETAKLIYSAEELS